MYKIITLLLIFFIFTFQKCEDKMDNKLSLVNELKLDLQYSDSIYQTINFDSLKQIAKKNKEDLIFYKKYFNKYNNKQIVNNSNFSNYFRISKNLGKSINHLKKLKEEINYTSTQIDNLLDDYKNKIVSDSLFDSFYKDERKMVDIIKTQVKQNSESIKQQEILFYQNYPRFQLLKDDLRILK